MPRVLAAPPVLRSGTGRSSSLHGQKLYSLRQDELAVDTLLGHVADHAVTGEQFLQLLKTSGAAIADVVVLEVAERDEGLTGLRNRCERRSQYLIAEESVRLTGDEGRLPHVLAVQILELAEGSDGLVVQDELRVLSVGTLQGVYQIDDVVGLDGGLSGYDACLRTALGREDAQRLAGTIAVQERVLLGVGQRLAELVDDVVLQMEGVVVQDPACGSGNFLTESYQCLRRLENRVLIELSKDGQISFDIEGTGEDQVKVSLANFHGIEINDFACAVARTALWIAEKQADADTASIVHRVYQALPLTDYGNVRQGNALLIDWNEVVPAERCSFICGNPPFIGHQWRTPSQQEEMAKVFEGVKAAGKLDYVCAWYEKAADYIQGFPITCALVSTNSICQGESVGVLWSHLAKKGIKIDFAHTTFVWDSQADDIAHVHVVIVGFSRGDMKPKRLFTNGVPREVEHINGYLSAAPDVFIANRGKPVNPGAPEMTKGSQPTDGGHLILSGEERAELVAKHPELDEVIRPFVGGREFLNGGDRWCLWFDGADLSKYSFPEVAERLQAVRYARLSSPTASVKRDAATPHLFTQIRQPKTDYLAMPEASSGRRKYFPVGYMHQNVIASNQLRFIPTDSLYILGLLSSQVHAAWMRITAGRLKSDYRYAPAVYNSFVFPDATEEQKAAVEHAAQAVLDARATYPDKTLARLYDPDYELFYPALYDAHRKLDAAVEAAYGVDFNGDEEKIVAHLFKLYAEKTAKA